MVAETTKPEGLVPDERWPNLLDDVSAGDRYSIIQTIASGWHEGWTPGREDIQYLVEFHCGEIDFDEYRKRVLAKR